MSAFGSLEGARLEQAAAADQALGLLQWGPMLLALPVAHLREVIACPERLAPMPAASPAVRGSVLLRGQIVPVLDLGQVLGLPPPEQPARVIVLMRCEGRLLGLLVGAVRGITRKGAHELTALSIAAGPPGAAAPIATHGFEVEGDVATLLDASRIAALPGLPMVAEAIADKREAGTGTREATLLFGIAEVPLGIDALAVEAAVPRAKLLDSPLRRGICRGVVAHHGHEVPVVDTMALLGLGETAPREDSAVLVLRFERGLVGLMIDRVQDIAHVAAHDALPLQAVGLAQPGLFRGMLAQPQHLLLNAAALRADEVLAGLAALSQRQGSTAGQARQAIAARAAAGAPFLTYRVGVELASPLAQVREIVTYPETVVPLSGRRDATLGLFTHRGAAMPLVCLASLRGVARERDAARERVLVVEHEGRRVGLIVQALCAIEQARWQEPADAARHATAGLPPLIEVGLGDQRRTLPRLDLPSVLRTLGA